MSTPSIERARIVAVDADGVMVNFASGVADFAQRTRGIIFNPEQIHPNPFNNPDQVLIDTILELLDKPEEIERFKPYPGTDEALHILCEEGFDPQIISGRSAYSLNTATRNWAETHGFSRFLTSFHLRVGSFEDGFKARKAQEIGAVAAFEDDDHFVYKYALAGVRTFHVRNLHLPSSGLDLSSPLITQHSTFLESVRALVGFK